MAWHTPAHISRSRRFSRARTGGDTVRRVPVRHTLSHSTLGADPPWIMPKCTAAAWVGAMDRDTRLCRAVISWAAHTMGVRPALRMGAVARFAV